MYKVFVNKTPIVLTDNVSEIDREKWRVMLFKGGKQLVDLVHSIESGLVKKPTVVYHYDIDELWFSFLKKFKYVHAGGGMVFNTRNQFLAIHRNGKWDLPKGHLKKGERPEFGAMREVKEECGIPDLKIVTHLANTFHMYERNGLVLKKTFWYIMQTDFDGEFTPQLEEGIDKVEWKVKADIDLMMKKSYPIIRTLLETGVDLVSQE
jgi:ADP-ribose pyrophosphatase YjhB (NUDIX family)